MKKWFTKQINRGAPPAMVSSDLRRFILDYNCMPIPGENWVQKLIFKLRRWC